MLCLSLIKKYQNFPIKLFNHIKKNGFLRTLKVILRRLKIISCGYKKNINIESFCKTFSFEQNHPYFSNLFEKYYNINKKCKNVLLISHDLSLTGAPIALLHFAKSLKNMSFLPIIVSPKTGELFLEYQKLDIPVVICPEIFSDFLPTNFISIFDFAVANTIICASFIKNFSNASKKIIWWIHESESAYSKYILNKMPETLPTNIFVFAVDSYAKRNLLNHRPTYNCKELLYCVPEKNIQKLSNTYTIPKTYIGKTVFCNVGTLHPRKGQDILIQAIEKLSPGIRNKAFFIIVGKPTKSEESNKIHRLIKDAVFNYTDSIYYIEQTPPEVLQEIYSRMDCFICSSRDDCVPIVVTESLMNKKIVICSENTGSASILQKTNSGLIFNNNSSDELANAITFVVENNYNLENTRNNAYETYKRYFSEDVFSENINRILKEITISKDIDMCIPTDIGGGYNRLVIYKNRACAPLFGQRRAA